jgi:hypothetical protein
VYFGHDSAKGLRFYNHAACLDSGYYSPVILTACHVLNADVVAATGCVYGGRLSAVSLPDERVVSVPAHKQYFMVSSLSTCQLNKLNDLSHGWCICSLSNPDSIWAMTMLAAEVVIVMVMSSE